MTARPVRAVLGDLATLTALVLLRRRLRDRPRHRPGNHTWDLAHPREMDAEDPVSAPVGTDETTGRWTVLENREDGPELLWQWPGVESTRLNYKYVRRMSPAAWRALVALVERAGAAPTSGQMKRARGALGALRYGVELPHETRELAYRQVMDVLGDVAAMTRKDET